MAILNKIRSKSIFLIIIIALALFAFIFSSILDSGGFSADKQNRIATINGENIDREAFAVKVEAQSRRLGPNATNTRAVNTVWDEEVNRVLLEEQYEELGIQVGKDRTQELLKQSLQNDTRFQDADGFYSEAKMQEFIATLKESRNPADYQSWLVFEESLRNQERQDIYFNLVKAGMGATLKDGEVAYKLDANTVDIQFVQIPYTTIPDEEVTVSKEEIQSYINAHSEDYKTEATRSIRFVKFKEEPSLEDENELSAALAKLKTERSSYNGATQTNETLPGFAQTEDIEDFVAENSDLPYQDRWFFKKDLPETIADTLFNLGEGAIYGPYKDQGYMKLTRVIETRQLYDSLMTRHILFAYQGAQRSQEARTKEEAQSLADSVFNVLKSNKSKFGELAAQFSSDASNKDNGGELIPFNAGMSFAQEFKDFVMNNTIGSMEVVETDFGFHIIDILDKKNQQKAMKVATVAKEILPSDKTISEVYNTTQKFEIAANDGDFQEAATASNLTVRPVTSIRAMDETLPGEGSQRSVIQWAFEEDAKVGDIKRFQVNDGYLVAQITRRAKKGTKSVEDVSPVVTPIIRNERKAEIIKAKISGTDLNAIAQSQGQTVKTAGAISMKNPTISGAGNEPKVVGAAFGLKEGEVSEPIAGVRGVYVVKVTKVTEAPELENYATYANQEAQSARGAVNQKVLAALKSAADIEDNRANFY